MELVYVGNHVLGHGVTLAVSVHRPGDSPGPRPRACKRHHLRNFVLSLVISFLGVRHDPCSGLGIGLANGLGCRAGCGILAGGESDKIGDGAGLMMLVEL